jgi:pimeloyl-ACP methyl ester carboxylesterase
MPALGGLHQRIGLRGGLPGMHPSLAPDRELEPHFKVPHKRPTKPDRRPMTEDPVPAQARSIFVAAPDGLRLHVRCHGRSEASGLPILCLPGLSRTTADFDDLAAALADGFDRRVLALDYRGRGLSDFDPDPKHYSLPVELADVIAVMEALRIKPAIVVGTSRGGLLAMLIAAVRPDMLAGVILNDIGPVIEARGLARIAASLGKMPQPDNLEQAAEILRQLNRAQFPKLTPAQWLAFAKRTWRDDHGRLALTYDPKLAAALESYDLTQPLPAAWEQFDALSGVPLMAIRGEHSDILSAETLAAMRARRPDMAVIEVPDQGHTPLLAEPDVIERIAAFVKRCDDAAAKRRDDAAGARI